ncbi:YaiI/YqxD family protein [Caproiciproducens sp. CPB-2]|uniref:YaiI/YqxD family protein n=1 Tax=Caproiciproducens sp. CPB-2 TaxID=3030017 RepID=UPI0023DB5D34|nr:YaiI/YqxD family protein [Caproiciproducens sp. CPB-2]MDF1495558.1 YaiI/YqxD family protein [Caproiciproducens sp. CPB-2]
MNILVDADACPVKEIIVRLAKKQKVPVIMLTDTSHLLDDGYSKVITVDKGRDSADIRLVNLAGSGDIVVTQDFGVAAMALAKGAKALNQNGMVYDDSNMDRLLFERALGQEMRRAGARIGKFKKRSRQDDESFERVLLHMMEENI